MRRLPLQLQKPSGMVGRYGSSISQVITKSECGKRPIITHNSSVRSSTKQELELNDPSEPVIKQGFRNISRKTVVDSIGRTDTINDEHKPHLLSLTTHGKRLMTALCDERIDRAIKSSIGVDLDEPVDPWWPTEPPNPDAAVYLRTYSDRSELNKSEGSIEVLATFTCGRCRGEIEHSYQMSLTNGRPVEGWIEHVTAECETCGMTYRQLKADMYNMPEPIG